MSPGDHLNPPRGFHSVLLALFFASGFVALLHQVIWERLLALGTALDLYAVTLMVAVFMFGMGLGSFAGGMLADRLPAPRLLLVFALAESIVALFALVSKVLYHDLLYRLAVVLIRSFGFPRDELPTCVSHRQLFEAGPQGHDEQPPYV